MRYVATLDGAEHDLEVEELDGGRCRIRLGENQFEVDVRKVGPASFSVLAGGRSFDFELHQEGDQVLVASRDGSSRVSLIDRSRRASAGAGKRREVGGRAELKAMMPGRVINVLVAAGDQVEAGQGVLIIEAMKMENEPQGPQAWKSDRGKGDGGPDGRERRATAGDRVGSGNVRQVRERPRHPRCAQAMGAAQARSRAQERRRAPRALRDQFRDRGQAPLRSVRYHRPRLPGRAGLPRRVSLYARRAADDVSRAAVDDAPVRRVRHRA